MIMENCMKIVFFKIAWMREYLGNKGVNSHIAKTLEDENDRDNFFYYNNGITVICDSVQKITLNESIHNKGFKTENPQIVNGCQTVNTIFETLNKYPESELENTFCFIFSSDNFGIFMPPYIIYKLYGRIFSLFCPKIIPNGA